MHFINSTKFGGNDKYIQNFRGEISRKYNMEIFYVNGGKKY